MGIQTRSSMGGLANKMIFQPPPSTYSSDSPGLIWLTIPYSAQPVPAFFVPHPDAEFTILFSHGNAEDLGCIFDWLHELSYHLKVNVLAYDYAGYGQSGDSPDEQKCYMAITAAFELLTQRMAIPVESIVWYALNMPLVSALIASPCSFGRSLGGGPSCELAQRQPKLGGLILQCTFTSVMRVISGASSKMSVPGDMFCNRDKLGDIKCPVLVVHGQRDEVIPFAHGKALAETAVTVVEPLWIAEAGHNNIEIYWKQSLLNRITIFLHEIAANAASTFPLDSPSPSPLPDEPSSSPFRDSLIEITNSPICCNSSVAPDDEQSLPPAEQSPVKKLPAALQTDLSPSDKLSSCELSPAHDRSTREEAAATHEPVLGKQPSLPREELPLPAIPELSPRGELPPVKSPSNNSNSSS